MAGAASSGVPWVREANATPAPPAPQDASSPWAMYTPALPPPAQQMRADQAAGPPEPPPRTKPPPCIQQRISPPEAFVISPFAVPPAVQTKPPPAHLQQRREVLPDTPAQADTPIQAELPPRAPLQSVSQAAFQPQGATSSPSAAKAAFQPPPPGHWEQPQPAIVQSTSHTAPASAVQSTSCPSAGSTALWQCQADHPGQWIDYSAELSTRFEQQEQSGETRPIEQQIPGTSTVYHYDVLGRIQKNMNSQTERVMRRVAIDLAEQQRTSQMVPELSERRWHSWSSWEGIGAASRTNAKARSRSRPADQWQANSQQTGANWSQPPRQGRSSGSWQNSDSL